MLSGAGFQYLHPTLFFFLCVLGSGKENVFLFYVLSCTVVPVAVDDVRVVSSVFSGFFPVGWSRSVGAVRDLLPPPC